MNTELFRYKLSELKLKHPRPVDWVAQRSGLSVSLIQKLRTGNYEFQVHPSRAKRLAQAIGVAEKKLFPYGF